MSVITALKQRQEDCDEFEVSLIYTVSSMSGYITRSYLKNLKEKKTVNFMMCECDYLILIRKTGGRVERQLSS